MRLRRDFCLGGLVSLPQASSGWRATLGEGLALLREQGYQGVIAWDGFEEIYAAGLIPCGMGRIVSPADAPMIAARHRDMGLEFTTVHVGKGFETDTEMDVLAIAVAEAAAATGHPLHIETHRATMTQDIKRTLDLIARVPDLTLTLDFSHWYTGHEMTYGGEFAARLQSLDPIFDRVRSIQIRIGSTGRIQAPFDPAAPHTADHAQALGRCLARLQALPNTPELVSFAPELLPARLPDAQGGRWISYADDAEASDRFADALALSRWGEDVLTAQAER